VPRCIPPPPSAGGGAGSLVRAVDVEGERAVSEHRSLDAGLPQGLARPGLSARAAERERPAPRSAPRERVDAAVTRRHVRNRPGGFDDRVDRGVSRARAITHDDEYIAANSKSGERRLYGNGVTFSGVHHCLDIFRNEIRIRRHNDNPINGARLSTRIQHYFEHVLRKRTSFFRWKIRRKPLLRLIAAPEWYDREHGMSIVVLAGGLGGSRFVDAIVRSALLRDITVIGNVGDDANFFGLHVSPDLDTIVYTLAGMLDEERGWGVRDESYQARETISRLGGETWFTLGDRDIGLHMLRTQMLAEGRRLSEVCEHLTRTLELRVRLLPATDDRLRTLIETRRGALDFQSWFVRNRWRDAVLDVRYDGCAEACPAPGVLESIRAAAAVFVAPSNPFVSIFPILSVPGIRESLADKRVVAISPLVGGRALRGPLAEMMTTLGHEPTAAGVRALYGELISDFVVDVSDRDSIAGALVAPIVMIDRDARGQVGREILQVVGGIV
jgi:LPPG:FO 2-phospho-L-lactate transferase